MNKYLLLLTLIPFLHHAQEQETEVETASWAKDLEKPSFKFLENTQSKFINDTLWIGYDDTMLTSKKLAFFYRLRPNKKKDLYEIKDYYLDGTLQMEGTFTDYDGLLKEGKVLTYRSNGTLEWKAKYKDDKLIGTDRKLDKVAILNIEEDLIKFKLPFKKTDEESDDSSSSGFRSIYGSNPFRSEFEVDEKYFTSSTQGEYLITKNNKTDEVVSRLKLENDLPVEGSLVVYNGKKELLRIDKENNGDNYKLFVLYDDGSTFLKFDMVDEDIKYFSPNGQLLASGDEKSGSFLYGLSKSRVFGYSVITPLKPDQSFIVMHNAQDGEKYIERYYNYNQPEIKFDPDTKTIYTYLANGELTAAYVLEDGEGPSITSGMEKIEKGYQKLFFPSGNLKSLSRYEPSSKIIEYYSDSSKNTIIRKEYLKKDSGSWSFQKPYKKTLFNTKGIKVFEEELIDSRTYNSVNYDGQGKELGKFTFTGSRLRDLNYFPDEYNDPDGLFIKTIDINDFTFFNSDEYSDISVQLNYEVKYEGGIKRKERVAIDDMVFIDYHFNGTSLFYNPITNKQDSCTMKNGVPKDGTLVEYYTSNYQISFSSIVTYENGTEIKRSNYDDSSSGTFLLDEMEIKNDQEYLTTYLNGRKYVLNKTLMDGEHTTSTGGRNNLLEDYMHTSDIFGHVTALFENGTLQELTKYKNSTVTPTDDEDSDYSIKSFIPDSKWTYTDGKISKIISYYPPDSRLSQLHGVLELEFKDGIPHDGEISLQGFGGPTYYRVQNGEVIQKVVNDDEEFYLVTKDFIEKTTLLSPSSTLGRYNQKIIYDRATGATTYAAFYDKKSVSATFDGLRMTSGVAYYTALFSGTTTLIVKNGMVYKFDDYIGLGNFNSNEATDQISVSSTEEQFIEFYDFGYSNPLLIDVDEYGDLSIDRFRE
jgi:hypothetical protein